MGGVVGDGGDVDGPGDGGDVADGAGDGFDLEVPGLAFGGVVELEEAFEGDEHAEHFFLVDFHAAGDGVGVGGGIEAGGFDEGFAAEEDAGALGAAEGFAAGEADEIEAEADVFGEAADGGRVGGGVVEGGDGELAAEADPAGGVDLAAGLGVVEEEHHGGLGTGGAAEVVFGFDFDEADAGGADGVVVAEAVGFLDEDFGFHAGEVGEAADLVGVSAGEDAGGADGHGARCAGGDHSGFGAEEGGDAGADGVLEEVEVDEAGGGVVDCVHDLGGHEGGGEGGVGAGGVDKGAEAEFAEVVAGGGGLGGVLGGGEGGQGREARGGLKEGAAFGHGVTSGGGIWLETNISCTKLLRGDCRGGGGVIG